MALEELRNNDSEMVEISKHFNYEKGVKVFNDEIENINKLENKLNTLLENHED